MQNTNSILVLENVYKSFGGKPAVKGVSFRVEQGEILGFLGPNGAGKTTSLRMALGLITPDSGNISLFGKSPGAECFGRIGFLPEERGLYRKIKARDAIAYIASLNGMKRKQGLVRADEMLEKYGLGNVKHKKIKDLSKGMAQKVQLIAAIAHDPEFLILDEPFSGLDPVNQKLLEDLIRGIAKQGRTILFSTHVMEHAERLCDKIVLLSDGQKIFDGSVGQALEKVPLRVEIETKDARAKELFLPLCKSIKQDGNVYQLVLGEGYNASNILALCVKEKLELLRFEPDKPDLHEAFVTLVSNKELLKKEKH